MHYIGLDVHKETIAVAIAPENSTEVRHYGIIGGTLEAVDKLVKKLSGETIELRFGLRVDLMRASNSVDRESLVNSEEFPEVDLDSTGCGRPLC